MATEFSLPVCSIEAALAQTRRRVDLHLFRRASVLLAVCIAGDRGCAFQRGVALVGNDLPRWLQHALVRTPRFKRLRCADNEP